MKKIKNHAGFSLIEMLTAIAILVLMIGGMGTGLSAGVHAYSEAMFESNSAALEGIINAAIGDVLRYSEEVVPNPAKKDSSVPGFKAENGDVFGKDQLDFVFSNFEYGVRNAYFRLDDSKTILQLKELQRTEPVKLVNSGAYPDLAVSNIFVTYNEKGHYFIVKYDIVDTVEVGRERSVNYTVRQMNPGL